MTAPTIAPPAGDWQPATAVYTHARLTFPGERTPATGLVIVPAVNSFDHRYTGGWSILHTGSGQHVGPRNVALAYAREAAQLLSQLAVDWTDTAKQLRMPLGLSSDVWDIHARVHDAWTLGRPTWFARHSWQHICPAWLVTTVDCETCGDYRLDTWPELVAWLTKHQNDPWYGVETITREPSGTWRLTCAAPLCTNHAENAAQPAVLSVDTDDGGTFEVRHSDRGDVAREALTLGWTRHDGQHWTCRNCSAEHAANPDGDQGGC